MKIRERISLLSLLVGLVVGFLAGRVDDIPWIKRVGEWSITIYAGPTPFDLSPLGVTSHPVLSKSAVTDIEATFVADPFLFRRDSLWYMFFEVLNAQTRQGDIAYARSADGEDWQYGSVVLDEPFHLSYPYVFEHDGEVYMIPESYQAYSIRLYRAVSFPTQWEHVSNVIEGKLVDASIVQRDSMWYLFAANPRRNDTLYLYMSENLTGPWRSHPLSPVVRGDANIARPGGRILEYDGSLYRFGQDDEPTYGNQLYALKIEELTPTTYRESLIPSPILTQGDQGWNADGMHHLDARLREDGVWIAAVDGYVKRWHFGPERRRSNRHRSHDEGPRGH